MRYPVDQKFVITSRFGSTVNRPVPHSGTDYVSDNKIVRAVENGYAKSGYNAQGGNFINITVGNKRWLYGHLRDKTNFNGNVTEGQQLGIMGATGNVTGVHLHLSLFIDGKAVDPDAYIKANSGNIGGNMALTPGQQDKLIKGMLGREPSPTELNDTNWRNNPGLAIDTLWEHGGKQRFANDRITPNELNDLTGALWGVSPADPNHHKNWDGKPFTEAYKATYNDPRTFEYADKVYKALNGGTKYKPYTLPELFVKE